MVGVTTSQSDGTCQVQAVAFQPSTFRPLLVRHATVTATPAFVRPHSVYTSSQQHKFGEHTCWSNEGDQPEPVRIGYYSTEMSVFCMSISGLSLCAVAISSPVSVSEVLPCDHLFTVADTEKKAIGVGQLRFVGNQDCVASALVSHAHL